MTVSVRRSRIFARVQPRSEILRFAITLLALLAFTFQAFVTQTHIHTGSVLTIGSSKSDTAPAKVTPGSQKQHNGVPNQDPANCPICQQIVQAGHYVTPAALSALAPAVAVSAIAIVLDAAMATASPSHSWRGRAPPAH